MNINGMTTRFIRENYEVQVSKKDGGECWSLKQGSTNETNTPAQKKDVMRRNWCKNG